VALLATNCPLAWSQIYPSGAILGIGSHLVLLEIQVQRACQEPTRQVGETPGESPLPVGRGH
jgi:hypothetical protein